MWTRTILYIAGAFPAALVAQHSTEAPKAPISVTLGEKTSAAPLHIALLGGLKQNVPTTVTFGIENVSANSLSVEALFVGSTISAKWLPATDSYGNRTRLVPGGSSKLEVSFSPNSSEPTF